jgi:phage tail sheath gpL-like
MGVIIPGLSTSQKTPGVYLNVILGGSPSSPGASAIKILLMGNKMGTAVSGASPAIALPAGTQPNATPVLLASSGDAASYFGLGSEIHVMARAVFSQYPDALVYGCSVAEGGGSAASVVCTFATTATAAYTVRVRACGETIDVPVFTGDTAATIATAVATAVNAVTWLPYYAQTSTGALTFTAKCNGPRGNDLTVILSFVSSAGIETQISTSSTTSPGATTGIMSGGAASGNLYRFAGGTTQDSFATALSAIASTRYNRIVGACTDATNVGRISTHIASQSSITSQKREQGICATLDTLGNATTLATGVNAARMQIAWHYNSLVPACMVAAQVCAARVNGDALTGVASPLPGENADPDANLSGVQLATIPMQNNVDDQPTSTEVESALNNGLTVIGASTARPGYGVLVLSITSLSLVNGLQNYGVLLTGYVTVCDYVADGEQAALALRYAGFRLGSNDANGEPPKAPLVTTPQQIRASVLLDLKGYESQGIIRDVDANKSLLVVEASSVTPGRVDMDIPVEPTPWLTILAGNVRQIQSV